MKEIKTTADIANATAVDLGPLAEIKDYVLELGPGVKIPGKVFGGAAIKAGGADFSLQVFAPGTEGGFYHTHKEHEELYFFLSGEGEYQVDGTNIARRPQHRLDAAHDALCPVCRSRARKRQCIRRYDSFRAGEMVI